MATAIPMPRIPAVFRHFVTGATAEVELPAELSVDELTRELVREGALPQRTARNQEQPYELFVRHKNGEAERLPASARVGDVIEVGDELEPMPEVVPGGGR
jgi:hypothetical protein